MSNPFIGEIRLFGRTVPPKGWRVCDGSILTITGNEALYSLIGTTYGGDGVSKFALPDFRGRLSMSYGMGPGLSPRQMGQQGGTASVALDANSMPQHNHAINVSAANADSPMAWPNTSFANLVNNDAMYLNPTAPNPTKLSPNPATIGATGQSATHGNMMPSLSLNYIICLVGIYPQRS